MNYENRVVLFLDILGFKSIIDKTYNSDGSDNLEQIDRLYEALKDMKVNVKFRRRASSHVVTQFSDSIVVSFEEDEEKAVFILFDDIQNLLVNLIFKGIICRGAISYGKLVHDSKIVFGPALIDAYETESKAALYPRVILDKTIVDIGRKFQKIRQLSLFGDTTDDLLNKRLKKDTDEKYFVDYFYNARYQMTEDIFIPYYVDSLKRIITSGQNFKSPDLNVKYGWMKNKFNNMVDILKKKTKQLDDNFIYDDSIKYIKKIKYID